MKVAIACDHLIARDYSVEITERLCEMFPKAPIYTFAFQEGNILGEIEHRKIHASPLSHKVKNLRDLEKYKFLFPNIASRLCMDADFDILISVSSGFAHGVKVPTGKKHISYIWNEKREYAKASLIGKFFHKFLSNWQTKKKSELDKAFYSSKSAQSENTLEQKVLFPPVVLEDFPKPYSSEAEQVLINGSYQSIEEILKIFKICDEKGIKYHCLDVGYEQKNWDDYQVDRTKISHSTCPSELKTLFEKSFAFVDLSEGHFNPELVIALALGRPLVVRDHDLFKEYFNDETAMFISNNDETNLGEKLLKMQAHQDAFFPSTLQKKTFLFHPTKFKTTFKKEVDSYAN